MLQTQLQTQDIITVSPEILSGTPVFTGTRVPVRTLFDHLEAGDSLEVFLEDFPSVSWAMAVAVLERAHKTLFLTEEFQQKNFQRETELV